MKKFFVPSCVASVFFLAACAALIFAGRWYVSLPVVQMTRDGSCVRVITFDKNGEYYLPCSEKGNRYLVEYVHDAEYYRRRDAPRIAGLQ